MPKHPLTLLPLILASTGALQAADEKITYQDDVRTVFENRCFNCHNPDKAKGGLDLTTYTNTMAGGSSGEVINPGASADSRLYKSVAHLEDPKMPPKGDRLPQAELDLIANWINSGVLETSSSSARKPKKPAFDLAVTDTGPGKPDGPPPMPEHLLLDPPTLTPRASAQADIASSPWAPLVALTGQKQVLLYNTESHQLAGVLPFPEGFPENLSFSRNGTLLLAAGGRGGKSGRVVVWDVKTGKRVAEVGNEFDAVLAADITSDNALIALGGPSRRIKIYNTSDGSELISIKKHTDWITALSFSPDGILLATGDRNGGLFVWEAATGNPFYTLKAHDKAITSITWRADSNIVASASEDGSIRLWEMNGGSQVKNWTGHGGGVTDLDFTRDGLLVSVGRDRHAKIWDQNGSAQKDATGFADIPLATAFSHDGKKFITGDWTGKVQVWDSTTAKPVAELSAAPPSVANRLAEVQQQLAAQQALVAAANKAHQEIATTLPAVQSRGSEIQKQLDTYAGQRQAADTRLQNARQAIAAATTSRENAKPDDKAKFEEQLKQAQEQLGAAAGEITELDKLIATADTTLKQRQQEFAVTEQAAAKAKVALDEASSKLAAIERQQQFWKAAAINTQRLDKAGELAKLQGELAFLKEDLAAADQAITAAQTKVAEAEKSATTAAATTAQQEQALAAAQAKIPAIDNQLRLSAVILENKRIAVANLNAMEQPTEAREPVLAAATSELQQAQQRHQDEMTAKAAAEQAAESAVAELEKARQAQAAAPQLLEAAQAELASAMAQRTSLQQSLEEKSQQVARAQADTDTLWASYQATLPN